MLADEIFRVAEALRTGAEPGRVASLLDSLAEQAACLEAQPVPHAWRVPYRWRGMPVAEADMSNIVRLRS